MTSEAPDSGSHAFHTFCDDDALGHHDATELAGLAQPQLRGLATPVPDNAEVLMARASDQGFADSGLFYGVPTLIKDNTDVETFPTGHGTAAIRIPAACCGLVGLKPSRGRMIGPGFDRKRVDGL